MLYNVNKEQFCQLETYSSKIKGIHNDLDGGLPFFTRTDYMGGVLPELYAGNRLITFYRPDELIEFAEVHSSDNKLSPAFKRMIQKLKDDDNPVIATIHLK